MSAPELQARLETLRRELDDARASMRALAERHAEAHSLVRLLWWAVRHPKPEHERQIARRVEAFLDGEVQDDDGSD